MPWPVRMPARMPAMMRVMIQPKAVLPRTHLLTPRPPSRSATPVVAPTWQWVVESGMPAAGEAGVRGRARRARGWGWGGGGGEASLSPRYDPMMMTMAAPSSMANPRDGVMTASLTPIAWMIW